MNELNLTDMAFDGWLVLTCKYLNKMQDNLGKTVISQPSLQGHTSHAELTESSQLQIWRMY